MPTRSEFALQLKSKYPQLASKDDNQLVDEWVRTHPEDGKLLTEPLMSGNGSGLDPIAMGLRIVPAALTPIGGLVGAAGAGAGETLAQGYEYLTKGQPMRPLEIAAQAGLGAIPFSGPAKGMTAARAALGQAGKGAAIGTLNRAVTDVSQGETPELANLATSAVVGGALGGITSKITFKPEAPKPFATTPMLDTLNDARLPVKGGLPTLGEVGMKAKEEFVDNLARPKAYVEKIAKDRGITFAPGKSPAEQVEIELGGRAFGRSEVAKLDIDEALKGIRKSKAPTGAVENLEPDVRNYLDLVGSKNKIDLLRERLAKAVPGSPEAAEATAALARADAGEMLPVGYTPLKVAQDQLDLATKLGPERYKRVKAEAQKVFDFNKETLDVYHKNGLVSDDAYNAMAQRGGHVHMDRILEETTENFRSLLPANLSKVKGMAKFKGSAKPTVDPFEAALNRRQVAEFAAAQNRAAKQFTQFADPVQTPNSPMFTLKGDQKPPAGWDVVTSWDKGKQVRTAMPKEIAEALKLTNERDAASIGQTMMSFLSRITSKAATTSNVAFAATNPIRDVGEKIFFSKEINPLNPMDLGRYAKDWATTLAETIRDKNNPTRREFLKSGAAYGTKQKSLTPEGFLKGEKSIGEKIMSPFEYLANLSEETTKISTFKNLQKKGITGDEQVIRTRRYGGSPDFGVKGSKARTMNSLMLFFNANVQGIARNIRGVREMPKGRLAATLGAVTAGEMARDEWNSQFTDPDGVPSAARITDNDRELYWAWVTPQMETVNGVQRHKIFKMTKPHALRPIVNPISSTIEMVRHGRGNVTDTVTNFAEQFIPGSFNLKTDSPKDFAKSVALGIGSSMSPALKLPAEQIAGEGGTEFFSNTPIVPKRMVGLPADMQYTEDTPLVLRKLGKATGLSPKRLESAMQSLLPGSVGEGLVELGNMSAGDPKASLRSTLAEPIARRFKGSKGDQYARNMEKKFYSSLEQARETAQALNVLKKEDPRKAALFVQENRAILEKRAALEKLSRHFSELRRLPDERSGPEHIRLLKHAMKILGEKEID